MSFASKINSILRNQVAGSQIVVVSGSNAYGFTTGFRSLEDNKPVEHDTIFRIASISKTVVAMAIMKLYEEGKLDLESDLGDIFGFEIRNPKYPRVPITVKMLMTHTSSITDGYDDENPAFDDVERGYNGVLGRGYYVELSDLLANKVSKYYTDVTYSLEKPGDKFIYSNFGTGILACVVEKVSGDFFIKYVKENILTHYDIDASFKAANLLKKDKVSDTFYLLRDGDEYLTRRTGQSFVAHYYDPFPLGNNFRGPAGGLFISMQDLAKIMMSFMNDGIYNGKQILKKETLDLMLQTHSVHEDNAWKATGLQFRFLDDINGVVLKGHTGSAYGVSSFMFFSKEAKVGICFIANGGKYRPALPGLNNVQASVLKLFIEYFYPEVKQNIVDLHLEDDFLHFNDRKVILNKSRRTEDDLYLDVLGLSSLLNLLPTLKEGKVYIKDIALDFEDGLISLRKALTTIGIHYEYKNHRFKIYV